MTTYTEQLYKHVIASHAEKSSHLKVISGYGSATFLNRVKNDFIHLNIELYLGMTHQGISEQDHALYTEWTKNSTLTQVYYQISPIPNHMKVLIFENESKKYTFVGSANFSENGFLYQRELMTEINNDVSYLIDEQRENSLLCTDSEVLNYVQLFKSQNAINMENQAVETLTNEEVQENKKVYISLNEQLKQTQIIKPYKNFSLEVVLPEKHSPHWHTNGINAWRENKQPHLLQTPKLMFDKIFPSEQMFEIYTDDGVKLIAKVAGRFNSRKLCTENVNLYKYVCNRIGLQNNAPISYENLVAYGRTNMSFKRVDATTYIMDFSSEK